VSELPVGWAIATVEELARAGGVTDGPFGSNLKTEHYTDAGPRVVRLQNIGDGVFRDERAHISEEHFARLEKHSVLADDVLVASLGEVLPRACLAPPTLGPAIVKADCIRIRAGAAIDPALLMWALNSPQTRQRVGASIKGVGRPRINLGELRDVEVPVPPQPEQERIISAIEEAFSKLDVGEAELNNVRQLLKRTRDAVLASAVTGGLVPQDPTDTPAAKLLVEAGVESVDAPVDLPVLPDGWVWSTLGAICESIRNGIFVSRPPDVPPGVPILRIGAVRRLELDLGDVRYAPVDLADRSVQRALLASGDLLFTRYNGNPAFVGACAVVPELTGPLLHPDKLIRAVVDRRAVDPNYVAIAASAGASRSFIDQVTKTTAGQAGIAGGDLKLVPVPVPPMAEQARIVAEVERQLSFIEACERSVATGLGVSAALRRSVLHSAFEGRLVPQDPTDEPASVLLERIRADRAAAPRPTKRRTKATA